MASLLLPQAALPSACPNLGRLADRAKSGDHARMKFTGLTASAVAILFVASAGPCLATDSAAVVRPGGWTTTVVPASAPSGVEKAAVIRGAAIETGSTRSHKLKGVASYYRHGRKTASGEPFNKRDMTAAHPTLPFNSVVRVTDRSSGSSVVVRINDRGPFVPGRVIDLSEAAAEAIGMTGRGVTPVELEVLAGPASASR